MPPPKTASPNGAGPVACPARPINSTKNKARKATFWTCANCSECPSPAAPRVTGLKKSATLSAARRAMPMYSCAACLRGRTRRPAKTSTPRSSSCPPTAWRHPPPPILVVSDRLSIRIHTQCTGHPSATHEVRIDEMDQPEKLALLRRICTAPECFKPRHTQPRHHRSRRPELCRLGGRSAPARQRAR